MVDPTNGGAGRAAWRVAALLLLLVAATLFIQRGVVRGVTGSHDLTMMYAGARQWVQGGNPYPLDVAYDAYLDGGGGAERPRDPKWFAQLYPPTTYAVMAPVGALRWSVARTVFCGLNLVGWAVAGWWVWGLAPRCGEGLGFRVWGLGKRGAQVGGEAGWVAAVLVAAGFLAWAPVHTTLAFGQLGGVVVGLVCVGIGRAEARRGATGETGGTPVLRVGRNALRGLALALACCLKPQLAGLFVVVLAWWGWGRRGTTGHAATGGTPVLRVVVWTLVWGALISAVAVGRLMSTAPTWWADLRGNLAAFAGTGFADPSRANGHAWQMINLEPWLRHVGVGEAAAGVLPWIVGLGALGWCAGKGLGFRVWGLGGDGTGTVGAEAVPDSPNPQFPTPNPGTADALLRLLAVAAVVSLLVVYHRTYDAVLLVFPAVWAWRAVAARGWFSAGGAAAVLIGVMGLPLPAVLSVAADRGWLPGGLTETGWWVPGALMHQNVALVVLLGFLVIGGGLQVPRRP